MWKKFLKEQFINIGELLIYIVICFVFMIIGIYGEDMSFIICGIISIILIVVTAYKFSNRKKGLFKFDILITIIIPLLIFFIYLFYSTRDNYTIHKMFAGIVILILIIPFLIFVMKLISYLLDKGKTKKFIIIFVTFVTVVAFLTIIVIGLIRNLIVGPVNPVNSNYYYDSVLNLYIPYTGSNLY
ncbi:MAG: hypothetical protein FWF46_03705 [Oscillospiraceae bacterium]|nr:hypothetical protein [Oscillospiraceae bacterium]